MVSVPRPSLCSFYQHSYQAITVLFCLALSLILPLFSPIFFPLPYWVLLSFCAHQTLSPSTPNPDSRSFSLHFFFFRFRVIFFFFFLPLLCLNPLPLSLKVIGIVWKMMTRREASQSPWLYCHHGPKQARSTTIAGGVLLHLLQS